MPKRRRRATHPGRLMWLHYMQLRGMDNATLASLSGLPTELIDGLVKGESRINEDIAERLAQTLNTSKEFWLNSQAAFDDSLRSPNADDAE